MLNSAAEAVGIDAAIPLEARPLPPRGRRVTLDGRGTTFVRELKGPRGAPTLLLLHGWVASGGLNWFQSIRKLGRHFRVLAVDHRGHARGVRTNNPFRLADCADDAAALLDTLGVRKAIAVGYSMGGPIGQLLWHRHPEFVQGLVLCATGAAPVPRIHERVIFRGMMAPVARVARMGQSATRLPRRGVEALVAATSDTETRPARPETLAKWAAAEFRRHDARMVIEAGHALSRYDAGSWIEKVDVPTASVVTTKDRAVDPVAQVRTALRIPDATIHRVEDGHLACMNPALTTTLIGACKEVAARS